MVRAEACACSGSGKMCDCAQIKASKLFEGLKHPTASYLELPASHGDPVTEIGVSKVPCISSALVPCLMLHGSRHSSFFSRQTPCLRRKIQELQKPEEVKPTH